MIAFFNVFVFVWVHSNLSIIIKCRLGEPDGVSYEQPDCNTPHKKADYMEYTATLTPKYSILGFIIVYFVGNLQEWWAGQMIFNSQD